MKYLIWQLELSFCSCLFFSRFQNEFQSKGVYESPMTDDRRKIVLCVNYWTSLVKQPDVASDLKRKRWFILL